MIEEYILKLYDLIQIPFVKVDEWLRKNNDIPYEETSALEGANVEVAFNRIAKQLLK